jgi:hypothetical protein
METLSALLIGALLGGTIVYKFLSHYFVRYQDNLMKEIELNTKDLSENMQILGAFKVHMEQAQEIMEKQQALMAQATMPSKSAAHSKYKNDLAKQLNELEDKKVAIFKKVINSGLDPEIAVFDGNSTTNIRMSEAIARREIANKSTNKETKTNSNNLRTKHLSLVKEKPNESQPSPTKIH